MLLLVPIWLFIFGYYFIMSFTSYSIWRLLSVGEIWAQMRRNVLRGDLYMVDSAEPPPHWKGTHLLKSLMAPRGIASNTWQGTHTPFCPTNVSVLCLEVT